MHKLLLLLLLSLVCHGAGAVPSKDGPIAWKAPDKNGSLARDRSTLLYFGAEWCPPCRVLETQIFNQQDVQAAMVPFAAVFVDGDEADTQDIMKRYSVIGFPAILVIAPDGQEAGRYMGSAKKEEFLRFLEGAAGATTPLAMLERLQRGKSLSTAQWTTLSAIEVADAFMLHYDENGGAAKLKKLRDGLARAVAGIDQVKPPLPAQVVNRLRIKALVLDAVSKDTTAIASHSKAIAQVLDDPAATSDLTNELAGYSEEILNYLHPDDTPEKRALARKLIKVLEDEVAQASSNAPVQIEMMLLELPLLPFGSDSADADKTKFSERVEALLKNAIEPADRLAIAVVAARLLRLSGREFRAEAVLRETLALSPEAFYLHDGLADFARRRGDMDQLVQQSEAAFRGALRKPTAFTWGMSWVNALIERNPAATGDIEIATGEVLKLATSSGDAFRGNRARWMSWFATSLGKWAATTDKSTGTTSRLLAGFSRLCDSVKQDQTQWKACEESSELVRNPPPEEKPSDGEKPRSPRGAKRPQHMMGCGRFVVVSRDRKQSLSSTSSPAN